MIRVIDDFVNTGYYKAIEDGVLGNFEWSCITEVVSDNPDETASSFELSHFLFDAGKSLSRFSDFLLPMFLQAKEETSAKVLLRSRADMTINTGKQVTHPPHIDMPRYKDHINMVFYIGDSDGDTIIYKEKFFPEILLDELPNDQWLSIPQGDLAELVPTTLTVEQRVAPKANRLVIFNGEHWHTSQSPKNHVQRVILNINFGNSDYRMNE